MPTGGFRSSACDGRTVVVDDLVLASSGPATPAAARGPAGHRAAAGRARAASSSTTRGSRCTPIRSTRRRHPSLWSFLNCQIAGRVLRSVDVDGDACLAGPPPATAAKLWKSWITHRPHQPAQVLHEAEFRHMLPTPASIFAQTVLRGLQGRDGIWFAGGYLSLRLAGNGARVGLARGNRVAGIIRESADARLTLGVANRERRTSLCVA